MTGRIPVIAAPTPRPVMPASEMGESMTRCVPNSCTRPERTLKGVPASATSSPIMKTVRLRQLLFDHPVREQLQRVALRLPLFLFLFTTVVGALNITDVMAVVAIGVAEQKTGFFVLPGALHSLYRGSVNGAHILPINFNAANAKGFGAGKNGSRRRLGVVCVLVVHVVFTDVDDGELPERSHVHCFIKHPLTERPITKETDGDLVGAAHFDRHGRSGRDTCAATDDSIRAKISGILVGNVHGTALASTIASLLAQQFSIHAINGSAFRQTVTVTAMGAGDVVIAAQGFADANGNGLLPDIEVSETGHFRAQVEFIDMLLKEAYFEHLLVGMKPEVSFRAGCFNIDRCFRMQHVRLQGKGCDEFTGPGQPYGPALYRQWRNLF